MPYTAPHNREVLDPIIDEMRNALRGIICDLPDENFEELMSYTIMQLISRCYKTEISSVIEVNGLLEIVKQEYNRTFLIPLMGQREYETTAPHGFNQPLETCEETSIYITKQED